MHKKKILTSIFLTCFLLSLSGCAGAEDSEDIVENEIPESMQNISGPTGPPYSVGPSGPPPSP